MAKRKKHVLTLENDFEFEIIGLCSHHNDYRLAWSINESLGYRLSKCENEYEVTDRKGEVTSLHSMYEFEDEVNRLKFYLIKNKSKGQYLIPEKPSIDYFLFLYDNNAVDPEELVEKLKSVSSILAAYIFEPEEVTSVENLVLN